MSGTLKTSNLFVKLHGTSGRDWLAALAITGTLWTALLLSSWIPSDLLQFVVVVSLGPILYTPVLLVEFVLTLTILTDRNLHGGGLPPNAKVVVGVILWVFLIRAVISHYRGTREARSRAEG